MRPAAVAGRHALPSSRRSREPACDEEFRILRVLGRPCDHLGIHRNCRQQHLGRPIGLAHALLPVAQRAQRDLVAISENDLRDLQPATQAGHTPLVALGLAGEKRLQLAFLKDWRRVRVGGDSSLDLFVGKRRRQERLMSRQFRLSQSLRDSVRVPKPCHPAPPSWHPVGSR